MWEKTRSDIKQTHNLVTLAQASTHLARHVETEVETERPTRPKEEGREKSQSDEAGH